ncbi:hypothetical protein [Fibrobacter sp. UWB12]|uniref:hypothetical protein n=1 Tax=Fibrobacter sp. UWB12 TaxID=1896203 RepID=UPI00091A9098|nr:hypothetical protein [Fibrobacter sp. UWB12]SHK52601.1 hypothetical protein SAMN05720759_103262 [Fibrobacter sp. UWB12]
MKKSILWGLLSVAAFSLCGCLNPHLSSMGASTMVVAHQPRLAVNGDSSAITLSADVFGGAKMNGRNIKDGFSAGASAALNYRPFGISSPLYVQAAFGGKGGNASLECSESGKCNDGYNAWLETSKGRKKYSFWNLQERMTVGADFDIGPMVLGLGAGVQLFEGGGDFDDIRDYLGKSLAENDDEGYGVKLYSTARVGARLGRYGVVAVDADFMWLKTMNVGLMLNYFHPSGFHGGVFAAEKVGYGVNFGKTFSF